MYNYAIIYKQSGNTYKQIITLTISPSLNRYKRHIINIKCKTQKKSQIHNNKL